MKAISLQQPWAFLIVEGLKRVEFRKRFIPFRGDCYIHASKVIDRDAFDWIATNIPIENIAAMMKYGVPDSRMFYTGGIIGKVTVVDCLEVNKALEKYPDDIWLKTAGNSLGRIAYIIENPKHFSPEGYIPCRGKVFPLFFDPELE